MRNFCSGCCQTLSDLATLLILPLGDYNTRLGYMLYGYMLCSLMGGNNKIAAAEGSKLVMRDKMYVTTLDCCIVCKFTW